MAKDEFHNPFDVLSRVGVVGHLSDGELLGRLVDDPDGAGRAAFAALVERHGPMVLRVCGRTLGDAHDVEDAFQATFLILARRAASVRKADSLASWLHGVALRVSRRARADKSRRPEVERRGAELKAWRAEGGPGREEAWRELHREIDRLPNRYREPIVLCCLEGLTTEAAAGRLDCPRGTILSRLSRGRERLRERLVRRGCAPAVVFVEGGLFPDSAPGLVARSLLGETVEAAALTVRGSAAGLISASTASLVDGVLNAMFKAKLKTAALLGLTFAALAAGVGSSLATQDAKLEAAGVPPRERSKDASAPVVLPLPPRADLHRTLRRASREAAALAEARPAPASWTLTTIAAAQAKAGDLEGARATFAAAANEAGGKFGGAASPWNLWRVGRFQAEAGLEEEARSTLRAAFAARGGVTEDLGKDVRSVETLAAVAREQAKVGAREDAAGTAAALLEFAEKVVASSKVGNARFVITPRVASTLAAVGDFEGAFRWAEASADQNPGVGLGDIAEAASQCLDQEAALRFVREAADRLAKIDTAAGTYSGLSDLAEAQARLGDVEAARRSAKAIGGGTPSGYDMTDGQPYALTRVAAVQRRAGDFDGAVATLRDAFQAVKDHPDMRDRDGRCEQVAVAQIQCGDLDGAARTVGLMGGGDGRMRSRCLAILARAQAAAGRREAARATFARAVEILAPVGGDAPGAGRDSRASTSMHLAEVQAMSGDVAASLKTMRSIEDENFRRYALVRIVSSRAAAGDAAAAMELGFSQAGTPQEKNASLQGLGDGVLERLSAKFALDANEE